MGNSHKNLLVWNQLLNWNQTLIKQSLNGPFPKLCLVVPPSDLDGCTAVLSLTYDPMGNSHKNHLVWNQQLNQNQTSKIVSGSRALPPRWLPQCSCIVIESSFDPGERLQAPGSLCFHQIFKILILFVLYFKIYKRQMLSLNSKHVQHVKIYIPCNFEVNLITHLGVIALFSSNFLNFDTFRLVFQKL